MLVLAIGVVLQALPRGPVGSRFLAPSIFTGVYLAPSHPGFTSAAHTEADVDHVLDVSERVLTEIAATSTRGSHP